ncbi:MAG: O-acetylhomoserine aminocarboxypropyltransferase/cysteine synthase [Clostridia bacterium]|nr:O-acetylhomoserine aminocarboxypropyltransferase/cysteine synthase [Clostridia bacterium]
MNRTKQYGFETLQTRAGFRADPATGAFAVPIYQAAAFEFSGIDDAVAQFSLEKPGSIYTRIANPTVSALEARIMALEGGAGTVCFASGMAAIVAAIQNLAESGSEIIATSNIYGGSYTLLFDRFEYRYGIKVRKVDLDDLDGLRAAITSKTRAVFIETLGNPLLDIPDFEAIARIAHGEGLPVIADNTFGSPYLFDAKAHGVDITVHSLTKYIGSHGTCVGGSVTDLGTFVFKGNGRFAEFNSPDPCYHGLTYADLGDKGYTAKLRAGFLRDTGGCLAPLNAYLILIGLETLSLRMERHSANALKIVDWLTRQPETKWVRYPGHASDPHHARAQKYLPRGCGGIFAFGLKGGLPACKKFVGALEIFSMVANVADVRSMVIHPASTTHSQLSEEAMRAAGIAPELIRVSVGLETVSDLIDDFSQALKA